MQRKALLKWFWALVLVCGIALFFAFFKLTWQAATPWKLTKSDIAKALRKVPNLNQLPSELHIADNTHVFATTPTYTIDEEAQEYTRKLFSLWKPDYGAFVAMDATTGALLTLVSYTKEEGFNSNLISSNEFPAASVFKIVTATAALDQGIMKPDTVVPFNGKGTTLYKRNVLTHDTNRWTRYPTLQKAFSLSFNTVFGKLGIYHVGSQKMAHYADLFGFNQKIHSDIPLLFGRTSLPTDDEWSVVEAASGFTSMNTLSPVHGAMMAASIANDGEMLAPYVVNNLKRQGTNEVLYHSSMELVSNTMRPKTAADMRELMQATVTSGTVRKVFRSFLRHPKLKDVVVGGKTGSLDSISPKGRCDWFVGYSQHNQQKIAFAAVTVHKKYWTVKSSTLVKDYLAHVYLRKAPIATPSATEANVIAN